MVRFLSPSGCSASETIRLVHLNVQSTGFCVPEMCSDVGHDINPCEYFADLDFPMDIFSPPQRKEFMTAHGGDFAKKILG